MVAPVIPYPDKGQYQLALEAFYDLARRLCDTAPGAARDEDLARLQDLAERLSATLRHWEQTQAPVAHPLREVATFIVHSLGERLQQRHGAAA